MSFNIKSVFLRNLDHSNDLLAAYLQNIYFHYFVIQNRQRCTVLWSLHQKQLCIFFLQHSLIRYCDNSSSFYWWLNNRDIFMFCRAKRYIEWHISFIFTRQHDYNWMKCIWVVIWHLGCILKMRMTYKPLLKPWFCVIL